MVRDRRGLTIYLYGEFGQFDLTVVGGGVGLTAGDAS